MQFTAIQKRILEIIVDSDKSVKFINQSELINYLMEIRGAKFISLLTKTDPFKSGMRKTANPYVGRLNKISKINGQVNFNYENAVNNQREREGNSEKFEAKESYAKVIVRDDGTITPLAEHKESLEKYLRVRPLGVSLVEYIDNNGNVVPTEALKSFIPQRKKSNTQETEKEIIYRMYGIDSVVAVVVDNTCNVVCE